jgi:hypothetical protein
MWGIVIIPFSVITCILSVCMYCLYKKEMAKQDDSGSVPSGETTGMLPPASAQAQAPQVRVYLASPQHFDS